MNRTTLRSGNWSDPTVWSGGAVPGVTDAVTVQTGHGVIYDVEQARVAGMTVLGWLYFALDLTATLESSGNVVVEGTLTMRPLAYAVHTLRFVKVDERRFVGGGMDPVASDVGLWVVKAGRLDAQGTPKVAWTRLAGGVPAGATLLILEDDEGWRVGDEIVVVPTAAGHFTEFDLRSIVAVDGHDVTVEPLEFDHPAVVVDGRTCTAEVLNLSRNVRIEGSKPHLTFPRAWSSIGGRAHIFIRNTVHVEQHISHAAIRYMGPRKPYKDTSRFVLGRYGLHMHHGHDANRGSVVEGVVMRDIGSHAFVAHENDGVTFRDCIAYDGIETPYWWDVQSNDVGAMTSDPTNDTVWDRCVAALAQVDKGGEIRLAGYSLATGTGNEVTNSVAVGIQGYQQASGFLWPEGANEGFNVWLFEDCLAHNNLVDGIFTWQNDVDPHVVSRFTAYHNGGSGIEHGAYRNGFLYEDCRLHGNNLSDEAKQRGGLLLHAVNNGGGVEGLVFRDITMDGGTYGDGLHISHHRQNANAPPARLERWTVRGYRDRAVTVNERNPDEAVQQFSRYDFVCWQVGGDGRDLAIYDFRVHWMHPQSQIRVQRRDGTAFRVLPDGAMTVIPAFAECPEPPPPPEPATGVLPPRRPGWGGRPTPGGRHPYPHAKGAS